MPLFFMSMAMALPLKANHQPPKAFDPLAIMHKIEQNSQMFRTEIFSTFYKELTQSTDFTVHTVVAQLRYFTH